MLRQAEDACAVRLGVAADALEYGRAIVDDVGHDVDLRLSHGMSFPLCQMFLVVCMGIRALLSAEGLIITGSGGMGE